jgi:hypothetical protein
MARRKEQGKKKLPQVRCTVTLDAALLERARKVLGARSDQEVIRVAVEHLMSHFEAHDEEE